MGYFLLFVLYNINHRKLLKAQQSKCCQEVVAGQKPQMFASWSVNEVCGVGVQHKCEGNIQLCSIVADRVAELLVPWIQDPFTSHVYTASCTFITSNC